MAREAAPPNLNLDVATSQRLLTSDLLPHRHEESFAGAGGGRFLSPLQEEISTSKYRPYQAQLIPSPKRGFTTRPATLIPLRDRIVYAAWVKEIRDRIKPRSFEGFNVIWPTTIDGPKNWTAFRTSDIPASTSHVVQADISNFYASINHRSLEQVILRLTGKLSLSRFVETLLGGITGAIQGIPQGCPPSDFLATIYLDQVDGQMSALTDSYRRHGDDIMFAANSFGDARFFLHTLESCAQNLGLSLNGSKTQIVRIETYESETVRLEHGFDEIWERAIERLRSNLEADPDRISSLLESLNREDLWRSWYNEEIGSTDVLDSLADELEPEDEDFAAELLDYAIEHRPSSSATDHDPWSNEQFHYQLVDALRRLRATNSAHGARYIAEIAFDYPDKTAMLFRHLRWCASLSPAEVAEGLEDAATSGAFRTPYQDMWLFSAMEPVATLLSHETIDQLTDELQKSRSPFVRAYCIRVLGRAGRLSRRQYVSAWSELPHHFRPDIIAAAAGSPNGDDSSVARHLSAGDILLSSIAEHVASTEVVP